MISIGDGYGAHMKISMTGLQEIISMEITCNSANGNHMKCRYVISTGYQRYRDNMKIDI